jgi:hypothetical protein
MGNLYFPFRNSLLCNISFKYTFILLRLGTSIPTAFLPGIGASILTEATAKDKAISLLKLVILDILTPGAG